MIELRDVGKTYRSGRGLVNALSGVSCAVEVGQALAVVGKSGSGKTTLLHCAGGLERPDSGRVHCSGVNLHSLSRRQLSLFQRRNIGFVFQFGNLLSYLTAHENVAFPLALNGVDRGERDGRARDLLERVGLPEVGPALPRELSGGETQRVSFARAIAHRPKLLLADEPTASLDSQTGREVVGIILQVLRDEGCTLVASTHDPVVVGLADRIVHLRDGHVVDEGEGFAL